MAARSPKWQDHGPDQAIQSRGRSPVYRMTASTLAGENIQFAGTGGISDANRDRGFRPAFRDRQTGAVYSSCHADGRPAAIHLFDGLPGELVEQRDAQGRVIAVRATVEAGFLRIARFFTRAQAAAAVATAAGRGVQ